MTETPEELERRLADELGDDGEPVEPNPNEPGAGDGDEGGAGDPDAAADKPADEVAAKRGAKGKGGRQGRRKGAAAKSSEDVANSAQARLDQAVSDYRGAVREIMGDDFAQLVESPLGWIPGYLWSPDAVPIDEPTEQAVLELLAGDRPPQDATKKRCPRCRGWGVLTTGSRAEGNVVNPCADCSSAGWVANVDDAAEPAAGAGGVPPVPPTLPAPPTTGLPDGWGRPAGHVHWGIPPADVGT